MKRNLSILSPLLLLWAAAVSCGPSKYAVSVELSHPTKSGVTLTGKTVSVAYGDSGVAEDSLFLACTAESFTEVLEQEYFGGEEAVGLFKVDSRSGSDISSKEGMVDLVMQSGSDLVFLFDLLPSQSPSTSSELRLYVYDSLSPADTVNLYTGKVTLGKWDADLYGDVVGKKSADIFAPAWSKESVALYYFGSEKWEDAVEAASRYEFKDAVDIWLTLVKSKSLYKSACAQYNIAAVCYIYGQNALALKWLDQADALYPIPESTTLRRKVNARL